MPPRDGTSGVCDWPLPRCMVPAVLAVVLIFVSIETVFHANTLLVHLRAVAGDVDALSTRAWTILDRAILLTSMAWLSASAETYPDFESQWRNPAPDREPWDP